MVFAATKPDVSPSFPEDVNPREAGLRRAFAVATRSVTCAAPHEQEEWKTLLLGRAEGRLELGLVFVVERGDGMRMPSFWIGPHGVAGSNRDFRRIQASGRPAGV